MITVLELLTSLAVITVVLWRLRTSPPATQGCWAHWAAFGAVHIAILLSVAIRVVRLASGTEPFQLNTALFYGLVAAALLIPRRRYAWPR